MTLGLGEISAIGDGWIWPRDIGWPWDTATPSSPLFPPGPWPTPASEPKWRCLHFFHTACWLGLSKQHLPGKVFVSDTQKTHTSSTADGTIGLMNPSIPWEKKKQTTQLAGSSYSVWARASASNLFWKGTESPQIAQEEKEPFQGFMLMTKHFTSQTDPTAPSHNDPTNQVTVHKTTPIQVENFKYGCWCQMSWSEYFRGK